MPRHRQDLTPGVLPLRQVFPTSNSLRDLGRESTLGGLRRQGKLCRPGGQCPASERRGSGSPQTASCVTGASLSPHVEAALSRDLGIPVFPLTPSKLHVLGKERWLLWDGP